MVVLLISFYNCSYFIAFYMMSRYAFNEFYVNVKYMESIYTRKSSLDNIIHGLQESMTLNKTIIINGKDEEIAFYIDRSSLYESDYQNTILKSTHP